MVYSLDALNYRRILNNIFQLYVLIVFCGLQFLLWQFLTVVQRKALWGA